MSTKGGKEEVHDNGKLSVTTNTMTREDFLRTLHSDAKHLQMWAICPYGGLGPMFRIFLFGDDPIRPLSFSRPTGPKQQRCTTTPSKVQLHMTSPSPCKLLMVGFQTSPPTILYGHFYTSPTPHIHFLQQFGLACTKAFVLHIRRPVRTQQAPQEPSGPARAPPGLNSSFSTDNDA